MANLTNKYPPKFNENVLYPAVYNLDEYDIPSGYDFSPGTYFNVQFHGLNVNSSPSLTYGKHKFEIDFQEVLPNNLPPLKNGSRVLFEFKDKMGTVIFSDTTPYSKERGFIAYVWIKQDPMRTYEDIEEGWGTLTICGITTNTDTIWRNKYNVRISMNVHINLYDSSNAFYPNETPIIFANTTASMNRGLFMKESFTEGIQYTYDDSGVPDYTACIEVSTHTGSNYNIVPYSGSEVCSSASAAAGGILCGVGNVGTCSLHPEYNENYGNVLPNETVYYDISNVEISASRLETYSGEVKFISTYMQVSGSPATETDPYHFVGDHILQSSSYEDYIHKDYGEGINTLSEKFFQIIPTSIIETGTTVHKVKFKLKFKSPANDIAKDYTMYSGLYTPSQDFELIYPSAEDEWLFFGGGELLSGAGLSQQVYQSTVEVTSAGTFYFAPQNVQLPTSGGSAVYGDGGELQGFNDGPSIGDPGPGAGDGAD